uniref:Vesicle tethering protein Uso1/P115-like head domain-containing protein n=1 Tax=Bartheletia paradoxa TaxID=669517 RepID=A0A2D0XKF0_9BASI|nr:hypothetical protein SPAR05478 [Bartheletia paradoxa]
MDWLTNSYTALRGDLGAPQTATDTVDKLVERIQHATLLEDRKAGVLGLKGLARDWKEEVGARSLPTLLGVLQTDAPIDNDIAKAVLETLIVLCEADPETQVADKEREREMRGGRGKPSLPLSHRFTDVLLLSPSPLHALLDLLATQHFYVRFFTLQLLSALLANRPQAVQGHVLTAPAGCGRLVEVLDEGREIIRNEALLLIISLTAHNADIQKIVAFEGAFERLFSIVEREEGIEGGIVVQDCLAAVDGLLRFNVSNQNYFRETSSIPRLTPLLLYTPPPLPPFGAVSPISYDSSTARFMLQAWPQQKTSNALLVLNLIRTLVAGSSSSSGLSGGRAANQKAFGQANVWRCLLELGLGNAPGHVKAAALHALGDTIRACPANQVALEAAIIGPYVYMPRTAEEQDEQENGANGWIKLPPRPAVQALVELALGAYPGLGTPTPVRLAALANLEALVSGNPTAQDSLIQSMLLAASPAPPSGKVDESAGSALLASLSDYPSSLPTETGMKFDPLKPQLACLLFASLLRGSEPAKALARGLVMPISLAGDEEDEDDRLTLVHAVVGNLMMADREQTESVNAARARAVANARAGGNSTGAEEEETNQDDWARTMCGYLIVLITWMWDSPESVRDFLSESANLQVLIDPITQSSGVDPLVQGLCAFLLGVCYEYNREPGPITRETLHPILHSRIGADQFVSRISRLREDPRFKNVGPDALEIAFLDDLDNETREGEERLEGERNGVETVGEAEAPWFDHAFVEFVKGNYLAVQRSIAADPAAVAASGASGSADGATAALVIGLRETIREHAKEVESLQERIGQMASEHEAEHTTLYRENNLLSEQVRTLTASHSSTQESLAEAETSLASITAELVSARESGTAREKELNSRVEELTAALATATDSHSYATATLASTRKELEDAHAANKKHEERHEDASKHIENARGAVSELQRELDQSRSANAERKEREEEHAENLKAVQDNAAVELATLRKELESMKLTLTARDEELSVFRTTVDSSKTELAKKEKELEKAKLTASEAEKEQEDLLVLLEELSAKRRKDKERMKEKDMEVSEDEDDDDDDDDEDDE